MHDPILVDDLVEVPCATCGDTRFVLLPGESAKCPKCCSWTDYPTELST